MAERRRNRRAGLRGAAPPSAFHAPANGNGPSGSAAITPAALSAPPVSSTVPAAASESASAASQIKQHANNQKTNLHGTFWEGPTSFFSLTWLGIQSLAGPTVSEHSP
ncbi:hypothetical protein OC861_002582 [Tilletia horrida]|nr:hypothetical protein OC861_002582 [Tilletia horrida]